jgi:hypothetical protein
MTDVLKPGNRLSDSDIAAIQDLTPRDSAVC